MSRQVRSQDFILGAFPPQKISNFSKKMLYLVHFRTLWNDVEAFNPRLYVVVNIEGA